MNNSSVKLIMTISLTVVITGCTIAPPKQNVIVGSGTMYSNWQDAVLRECRTKAWEATKEIVIKNFEQVIFTDELIKNIHEHLLKKCSMNSGLVI